MAAAMGAADVTIGSLEAPSRPSPAPVGEEKAVVQPPQNAARSWRLIAAATGRSVRDHRLAAGLTVGLSRSLGAALSLAAQLTAATSLSARALGSGTLSYPD